MVAAMDSYPQHRVVTIGDQATAYTVHNRHEQQLLDVVADVIRPRPRMLSSEWGALYVDLPKEVSPHQPGRFDPAWKPWIADFMDLIQLEPEKRGVICMKKAQAGLTMAALISMYAGADMAPRPML